MLLHSNWFVAALVMAAAIAAGISTINAMLLVSSQIVSQDLVLLNKKGKISDKQNMLLSRSIVLAIAVVCGIMALDPPETLVQIVQDVAYTGPVSYTHLDVYKRQVYLHSYIIKNSTFFFKFFSLSLIHIWCLK